MPYEVYAATEAGVIALQSWLRDKLTPYPYFCFLEFISESELKKEKESKNYSPSTVLIDELIPNTIYELVITNFYGMPFMRYRMSDLIKVISLEEEKSGIKIPQFIFHSRASDMIDLYSIVMLDEKIIWQALNEIDVKIVDWSARKEYEN
ncbi:MAG: GH3 auxin-responsive promoter family protein, partial [Chloroflexi bacterium]|nr:GH3 auxin-responsive promoter family protein [Chloroflexota bacterium]